MKRTLGFVLILIMLTACASAPAATSASAPTTATPIPLPTPEPVLEVQMQWQAPDQAYDNSSWWQSVLCFYGEPLSQMLAAPDYGPIYPYLGAYHVDNVWGNYRVYGLCTADGQIITAPIYTTAFRLFDGENEAYLLHIMEGEKRNEDDEPCLIMAADGSWFMELEAAKLHTVEGRFSAEEYDVGYLAVKQNSLWGILSYDGEVIEPFIHETPDGFYREGERDERYTTYHWLGGDIYQVLCTAPDNWSFNVAVGDLIFPGHHASLRDDLICVYAWIEVDKDGNFSNDVLRTYDLAGNLIKTELNTIRYWEIFSGMSALGSFTYGEANGRVNTVTSHTPAGQPLVTVRPITFSMD